MPEAEQIAAGGLLHCTHLTLTILSLGLTYLTFPPPFSAPEMYPKKFKEKSGKKILFLEADPKKMCKCGEPLLKVRKETGHRVQIPALPLICVNLGKSLKLLGEEIISPSQVVGRVKCKM